GGRVRLRDPGGAGIGRRPGADFALDPPLDLVAVPRIDGGAGHARRPLFEVEQHLPRLLRGYRDGERVLQLHKFRLLTPPPVLWRSVPAPDGAGNRPRRAGPPAGSSPRPLAERPIPGRPRWHRHHPRRPPPPRAPARVSPR